ncbi:MAG: cysteine hydrolase family protein [Candidatus Levyibacteriota bacterium]
MKIPQSVRKKALFIIDVQPEFLDKRNDYIIENIHTLLENTKYDLYVEAVFYSKKGSLWDKQRQIVVPKGRNTHTVKSIAHKLKKFSAIKVEKQTRSVFKDDKKEVFALLKEHKIEEIHFAGTQANDCIFASAIEAFDLGFFSYVIEECCETATKELQEYGLALLRRQKMTNNSIVEKVKFLTIA